MGGGRSEAEADGVPPPPPLTCGNAGGKTSNEAMRLLKRRLPDIAFRTMLANTVQA
ncbi:hypothetical protein GCM10027053_15140 [Intrasporangium mesophilum]